MRSSTYSHATNPYRPGLASSCLILPTAFCMELLMQSGLAMLDPTSSLISFHNVYICLGDSRPSPCPGPQPIPSDTSIRCSRLWMASTNSMPCVQRTSALCAAPGVGPDRGVDAVGSRLNRSSRVRRHWRFSSYRSRSWAKMLVIASVTGAVSGWLGARGDGVKPLCRRGVDARGF